jgi:hypothetical protein
MIWHEKNQRDPIHAWLRERMAQVESQVRMPESE